jgi:hypothetical protein
MLKPKEVASTPFLPFCLLIKYRTCYYFILLLLFMDHVALVGFHATRFNLPKAKLVAVVP